MKRARRKGLDSRPPRGRRGWPPNLPPLLKHLGKTTSLVWALGSLDAVWHGMGDVSHTGGKGETNGPGGGVLVAIMDKTPPPLHNAEWDGLWSAFPGQTNFPRASWDPD